MACSAIAGMMDLKSGSLDFLKSEAQVNIEYSYDGMRVGSFVQETEYLDKKTAEYNAKEAGRGDRWRKAWVDDRTRVYQPKFEELCNKMLAEHKKDLKVGAFKDAKYTLLLKTTFTDPGWNIGLTRRPAFISAEATFVDTKDRSKVIAVVTITKSPGQDFMGVDYDASSRLGEAYAKAGKELGIFIWKKTK